ncbi:hypothetical protein G6F37_005833 [Rhizopus arrhizus]|nr:hypothetical protein G6F38_005987 [Rhizopus arrhizus]KAG1158398.1 hypothetical protein G6F37_005833 [Rhizopus arrhizus]
MNRARLINQQRGSTQKTLKGVSKVFRKVPSKASHEKSIIPKRHSLAPQTGHNVEVVLRCKGKHSSKAILSSLTRPSALMPVNESEKEILLTSNNTIYRFDHIFYQECSQQQLYDQVGYPVLQEFLNGYNCTIFAYGQTGTGKTYTMEGDLESTNGKHALNAGIIPRIICNLFSELNKKGCQSTVKMSMLELYNEELRDLLYHGDDSKALNVFEDGTSGVKVQNVYEELIINAAQGLEIMKTGVKKRITAATNCNEKSSRSHCIFTITVTLEGKNEKGEIAYYTSKLNLVDLAGSENSKISGSEHLRAKEAASINKSLLTLGRVINSLADKAPHIPYRESKLTRLLKDSLGGRTKTVIITTVDPFVQNMEDIKNTLEYGSHAKSISNLPQKNPLASQHMTMSLYKESLVKMQEQLRRCWEKNGRHVSNKEYEEMLLQIEVSRQKVVEKEEEMLMKIEISKQKMTEKDEEIKAIKAELEERRRKEKEREEEVVYWKKKLEDRDKEIEEIKKKEEEIDEEVARIEKEEEKAEGQRKKIDAECVELAQKRRTLESKRRQIKNMKRKRENEDEAAPMKKRK